MIRLYYLVFIIMLIILVGGCATVPERISPTFVNENERARIVEYAKSLLGKEDLEQVGSEFRSDCSGYVVGVYKRLGYKLVLEPQPGDSSVAQSLFWMLVRRNLVYRNRRPKEADLVFFKGTTDRRRYRISHVGLIAFVGEDETILILHYSSEGVSELRMNLRMPSIHKGKRGHVLNDFLRKEPGDRLSGQLFSSYGDLLKYVKSSL